MGSTFLTLGRAYITESFHVTSMPPAGKAGLGKAWARYPDGSAVNTAVALSRLGVNSCVCAKVGDDEYGEALREYLKRLDINSSLMSKDTKLQTGVCCTVVENLGVNRKILIDGANKNLREGDIEYAFTCKPRYVIVNGDIGDECTHRALELAVDCNSRVILSLCSDFSVDIDLESLCSVELLVIDPLNAKRRTGIAPYDIPTNLKICSELSQQIRAKYYILRCADGSCFIYDGKYYMVISTYEIDPLDDTASIDSFNVSLFLKYLLGGNIKAACEFAVLCEVITAQKFGGAVSIPNWDEIRKFVKENQLEEEIIN